MPGLSMPAPFDEIFHGRIADVDPSVGQMIAALLRRCVTGIELEHVDVEIGHALRVARPQREMAEGRLLLPFVLGVDLGAVLMPGLRQVDDCPAGSCAL